VKIVSFDGTKIGVLTERGVVDVSDLAGVEAGFWPPVGMVRFIAGFDGLHSALAQAIATREALPRDAVRLETPVPWPNKVIAFPANYHAHIEEMGAGLVSTFKASGQGFFLKANSSLSGPSDPIVLPDVPEREIHHECELAIIIGKGGRDIARDDALAHIFGYSCLLDIVIRGKEERVMRKSFDSFCPVGPWITTADEITDPSNIGLTLRVNGELRQQASTRDLIVDIPEMIAMASSVMTLMPGDIIATGTPAGVARIDHGDRLLIEIDGVGAMEIGVAQGTLGRHSVWDKSAA
jgi:2-keto-4-pentenoate hydratase/2-oxohepta-3-ene-1,7-dioic acid hydratase in catechol pathway